VSFVYEETETDIVITISYKHQHIQTDDSAITSLDC